MHAWPSVPVIQRGNRMMFGKAMVKRENHSGVLSGARLALANDPDADRMAASEWQPGDTEGTGHWYAFTGNEIGILLASWLWEQKYKVRV